MPQNDLQVLYQAASKKFNVGTYENFEAGMRDPKKRKSFYDAASKKFKLSSYENFSAKIDSLTSIPGEKPGEDARITSTPDSPKEEKLTGDTTGKYSWGRATSVIDPKTGTRKEPEWRSGSRPVTDYATVDKEPVTSDAIWKTGLNAIGAKDPDQYDFINRRMELGSHQLNEFTKFKVEKEGVQVNAQKISGLLNKAKEDADKASRFYEEAFSKIEKQLEVAKAANDVEWQNKLIAAANMVIDQQKADPVFKTYNDLVTKYNELSKYEKELPAKYPMVKEQQAEVQKVNDEYKDGGFWTKAYFQTAYPAMGAFNEISKSIMGASDHLANLTGLMSNDELRDYTEYKKGTIAMPAPDQTELFNPGSGKFQAAGILPTMFKVGLQSYGFYKGGAIINQTGIPMGASQWLSVFTQTYPMFYEQGIESGLSSKEAQTYAALSSGTEAMIERILPEEKIFGQMLPNITKVYKGVKALDGNMPTKIAEFTKGYLRVAIPEVTEEVLADVAQNIYQNTANDMVQSSFDVKPLTMQEEAKTIVTTAIGMAPMSLMGGYNRVKNITKVARYEAGLAPKSYIEFAEKQFAKKAITQKAYDNIVKTANSMAEIIDQIPDVTASGRKMTKEKKIELANLLYEQKLLAEKKAASPPLFQAAFDEAAADLEERMNKAYGLKVEENEMEEEDDIIEYAQLPKAAQEAADRYRDALEGKDVDKSLPTLEQLGFEIHEDMDSEMGEGTVYFRKIEPVAATEEQTEELDEETAAEIEGLKGDIAAGAGGPTVSKIETVGDKEFYSHGDNEYEVKSGADGSIEFINSTSGQVINRKSTNYDAVAAGYIMEKFADAPDTESNAPDAQGYYMDVAAKSTNPLEILVAASSVDEMEGESDRASAKDQFLGLNSFITFTEEDVRRKFGYGLSDMPNWQAIRDNYYQKKGKVGIDQAANDANRQYQDNWEGRSDESITEDDLWDFIERFPYGYDESQMMGPLTKSLADRFTTVTGIPMDRQMIEAFRDLRTKANSIAKKDQDAMFDWFAEHPGGTIEELQQDVELTEETKTILDETESTPFPWETEESQEAAAGSSEAGDDAVKDETQRQEEKQPEIISQSIVVTPDKIVGGDAAFGDQVELIDGTKGRVTSVTETQVGKGKNAKREKKLRVTLDKGSTDVAPVKEKQPKKEVGDVDKQVKALPVYRGIQVLKGGTYKEEGGYFTYDKEEAESYSEKFEGEEFNGIVVERKLKPDAKVLHIVTPNDELIDSGETEYERITGSKYMGEGLNDFDPNFDKDMAALKKAGYDAVAGNTIDGPVLFVINKNALTKTETAKPASQPLETASEEVKSEGKIDGEPKTMHGARYSDVVVGNKRLEDILDEHKLSEEEKGILRSAFRMVDYFKFNAREAEEFENKFANPESLEDVFDVIQGVSLQRQSDWDWHNEMNYRNSKEAINYIVDNPNKFSKKEVNAAKEIKSLIDNPESSSQRIYAVDALSQLGLDKNRNKQSQPTPEVKVTEPPSVKKTEESIPKENVPSEQKEEVVVTPLKDVVSTAKALEEKKAEIEKRREAELKSEGLDKLFPVDIDESQPGAKVMIRQKKFQDKINAKYDAELKAVESALTKDQPKEGSVGVGGEVQAQKVIDNATYTPRHKNGTIVRLPIDLVLENQDPDYAVERGKNEIGSRVDKAKKHLESNPKELEASDVYIKDTGKYKGKVGFSDGRHRLIAAKELGATHAYFEIPATKEQFDALNYLLSEFGNESGKSHDELTSTQGDYRIIQTSDNSFLVNMGSDIYAVKLNEAGGFDNADYTKNGKKIKSDDQLNLAIQDHLQKVNPESNARNVNKFIGRDKNAPIPTLDKVSKKEQKKIDDDLEQSLKDQPNQPTNKKSLPEDFRDLSIEDQGGVFVSSLNKGEAFTLGNKQYSVKSKSEKQTVIVAPDGKNITVKHGFGVNYGNNTANQFFRDIEGELTVDLINENNPLHEFSDVYKKTKQRYSEILNESKTPAAPVGQPEISINFQKGASYTDPQGNGITIIGNKGEKEGDWAIFYKGKSSVRSESDITNLIRNGESAAPVKTELDAEIDNFAELFNKIKKKRNNPGIINDPQQDAEDDLELISAGAKLVKVAMKTGLHKFADIVAYAAKRIGDTINELLPYMQKAYTSLLGDTSISEADLDKMEDPDDDFTPSDNEVNEPPSDALYNAQKKIEDKLDQLDKGLDDAFKDISGAYILPPKPILKAALKIIRYSVKAGFSIARAFRNGYRYIQTTDWYRERVAQKNPYDLADLQQMLTDYGVTQATDLDSLDKYLKRIRKFVNGATPAELESALNNLTNFITQRVKSIGLSDTRLFLDAIDKIRKSQGSPTRLATAIVNFEKAVDQFIYREQYRDAIRAKREARRNLVKGQKFPDIRLLGMELVNLPIVKNREKIPIELLWKYLEAINPLAVKGKELIPNVRKITEVIREVTDWANSIADREESDRGARDTTDADARKEQQMDQWRQDIDRMKASFDPASIVRAPEIDGDLQQMIREFVALDHNALEYAALKNYWGIMVNLSENKLVSPNIYNDWVLPKRKQVKVDSVSTMAREVQFYFDNIRELVNKLRNVPKTLWDAKLLRPDPALRYDAPFWNHFIQPLVKAIEKFRIDYQTVAGGLEKLYQKLGKHSLDRAKAAMEVRMWAFANQVDHNRPDIDFKKKLNQSLANMSQDPLYSDIYKDYLDAYNSLVFAPQEGNEPRLIDLQATFDAFTPAQKAFAQGLASLVSERLQPIVQYQQMYVRGENVNFIAGYHPMSVLGGVNVEEATTESQVEALLSNTGMRGTMLSTKAGSMFARTYPKKVFYSFSYPSLLDSIEGTFFDKHLTEPVKEVFGAMISGDFTTAFTSSLASEMRKQMMSMLKHEIGFNEQTKSIEQRLIDSLIRALTGRALVSIKRFAEAIPNWSVAAPHISDNPYDAVKTIYNSSRNFFDHPREWLEMMRDNGFSVYMRFSTHSEMIDTPGGKSIIIHNPFLNPLKHLRESKVVRKIYDQQNKTKFEQLASDAMTAFANNNVSRMGVLIQQMSIGIGDYVSSFPIWVASFNQHLTKHGYPEWVPGGDNSAIPQEAITAAGNFAENVVDRSVGTSNRGRSAEKTYSFTTEDERKRWYAYALGRFNWFLGVLMFQQTAYFRHHAANLIKGGGEYGRVRSAGVLAGLIAGNVAFNLTTKIIGAIIIGLGGDDEAKKKQLADLGTKEYWARNLGSALLQLSLLGKMPYFSKIIMSMGVEALNKYITEEVMDQSYNSYHDALVYSPRLPLPTEWAQSKQVYNAFMPFMSPIQSIYEPIMAGTDMVANGNPTDDALVKFNIMKAALAITNLAITIPFVNKEVYGVLNAAGMPVKASEYDNLRDIKKERTDLKDAAKKDFDSNYASMDPELAKERLDSLILEAPNTAESERLHAVKKLLTQPKYDQMTAFDKFLHSYPAAAKAERIKQDLNTMPSEQIKEKLEYYRKLGVISQNIYQELMDEMYLSQHLDQMTPQQRREHRYRMEQRKSK